MEQVSLWKFITNGEDFNLKELKINPLSPSLDAISANIPGGVYTTFRTFSGQKSLPLKKHFDRLKESAKLAGMKVEINHDTLRSAIKYIVEHMKNGNLRVRITIDLEQEIGSLFIATESLQIPPKSIYKNGGTAITFQIERKNPKAKLTDHLNVATQIRNKYPKEINEVLAVAADGTILEGLSSNFFAVKGEEIWTAGENVLLGTIRRSVINLARENNIAIRFQGIKLGDLSGISEAFITSTSRSILPITKIDNYSIDSGKPGEITKDLVSLYNQWVQDELEVI